MNLEVAVAVAAMFASVVGAMRWLIHAWFSGLEKQRTSPTSTAVIVDASVDVVGVLRQQLAKMTVDLAAIEGELIAAKQLVAYLEEDRDTWRHRAIELGWVEDPQL